jgi:hypothetical protein
MALTKIMAQVLDQNLENAETFWEFVEKNGYEKRVIKELIEKAEFWVRKTPKGMFSKSFYYDSNGHNYTQLDLHYNILTIDFNEIKYIECEFPRERFPGSYWKGSLQDSKRKISLEELIEIGKERNIIKEMGNSLIKSIIKYDISEKLDIKSDIISEDKFVCLHYIEETENIRGFGDQIKENMFDVVTKKRRYQYFWNKKEAEKHVLQLKEEYQKNNVSLELGKDHYGCEGLIGQTHYHRKHEFQIIHKIVEKRISLQELSKMQIEMLNQIYQSKTVEKTGDNKKC